MVNAARIKRNLPSFLLDGSTKNTKRGGITTTPEGWNKYQQMQYQFKRLQKRNPARFNTLMNKTIAIGDEWVEALSKGS